MSEVAKGKGTQAGEAPGPFTQEKGDVTHVAAFLGGFVMHTEEGARENASRFTYLAPVGIYRIELIDVLPQAPAPAVERA